MSSVRFVVPEGIVKIKRKGRNNSKTLCCYTRVPINVTEVVIPNTVEEIGEDAFSSFDSLEKVNIPKSVKTIGRNAFRRCALTAVDISGPIKEIREYVFACCDALTAVRIPDTVTKIHDCAFDRCTSLTSIDIPKSVAKIGYMAFNRCESLSAIRVSSKNPKYRDIDGVLFEGTKLHI